MRITYTLHNPSQEVTSIYVNAWHERKNYANWSTGQKIEPKHWDGIKHRARKNYLGYKSLNALLGRIQAGLMETYRQALINDTPLSKQVFRAKLDQILQRKDSEENLTFFGFFRKFIKERQTSPEFAKPTVQKYQSVYNALFEFNPALNFDDLNLAFFFNYTGYLFTKGKGRTSGTVNKHITILKVVLRDAQSRGLPVHPDYLHKQFNIKNKVSTKVYLNTSELTTLLHAELEPRLGRVRDLALVAAYTGQRYSDLRKIHKGNLITTQEGVELFKFTTKKSGHSVEVAVPIHPIVRQILDRYGWQLPVPSNQKFNAYIKEACQAAGLEETLTQIEYTGGQARQHLVYKWELVSAHTFRRSFVTNAILSGVDPATIGKVTGQTDIRTTMGYDVSKAETAAGIIYQSDFFRGGHLKKVQ